MLGVEITVVGENGTTLRFGPFEPHENVHVAARLVRAYRIVLQTGGTIYSAFHEVQEKHWPWWPEVDPEFRGQFVMQINTRSFHRATVPQPLETFDETHTGL